MVETIFGVAVLLGFLFLLCKLINKMAQVCGLKDVIDVIGESMAARSGSFLSNRGIISKKRGR